MKNEHDPVNHPEHYTSHPSGVECITVTEHMNFNLGNVVKYLWRADGKGGALDLHKARWYLEREIKRRAQVTDDEMAKLLSAARPTPGDAVAEVRKSNLPVTKEGVRRILKSKALGKRVRRSAEDIDAMGKKLLAYVTKHPGQRGEQIAKALGTDVGKMRKPMKSLGYLIRTKGKRRGTTYFAK